MRLLHASSLRRFLVPCLALLAAVAPHLRAAELVEIDAAGVIRWKSDQREVALFGANYCLPSASDYRAAKRTGADLPQLIQQDFTHFQRMGWDALRLSFWGDWENSDREGNLIANEHLDLLDRCIAEARQRGLYILFSPITNHASWWPDSNMKEAPDGFSKFFEKSRLGTDPKAIAVQANYLKQILNHVNPHTGVALKDEPNILFVELINEPWHHSDDRAGSIAYINALVDAIRSTGCEKLLLHNVSQDFAMAPIIRESKAQGVTFGWYPTGLLNGRTLEGNHLRSVDDYPPMRVEALRGFPSLVYEFDSADQAESTMIPAMTRTFRSVGAQFAAIFSYDMLASAPTNGGWQTHVINLVYSPRKAVASVIAAEAMRRLPRGHECLPYPENLHFGPFRVHPDLDLAELVLPEVFMNAGDTVTAPPEPEKLERVVGYGVSPVVHYEGRGAYFLDRIEPGVWRLEVYPDALFVQDPFARKQDPAAVSSRSIARSWPMELRLPDLGPRFQVLRLSGNAATEDHRLPEATDSRFPVEPGIYVLHRAGTVDVARLPATVNGVPLRRFVCPEPPKLPPQAVHVAKAMHPPGFPIRLEFELLTERPCETVTLWIQGEGEAAARPVPLQRGTGYRYFVEFPSDAPPAERFVYRVTATQDGLEVRFPSSETWEGRCLASGAFTIMHGASIPLERWRLTDSRTPRTELLSVVPSNSLQAGFRLVAPRDLGPHQDFSASREVIRAIASRGPLLRPTEALRLSFRADPAGRELLISLVERDGTTWSHPVPRSQGWTARDLRLANFQLGRSAFLPTGYPGNWNYWRQPPSGRGQAGDRVKLDQVEHIQFSFRPRAGDPDSDASAWLEFGSLQVVERGMKPIPQFPHDSAPPASAPRASGSADAPGH